MDFYRTFAFARRDDSTYVGSGYLLLYHGHGLKTLELDFWKYVKITIWRCRLLIIEEIWWNILNAARCRQRGFCKIIFSYYKSTLQYLILHFIEPPRCKLAQIKIHFLIIDAQIMQRDETKAGNSDPLVTIWLCRHHHWNAVTRHIMRRQRMRNADIHQHPFSMLNWTWQKLENVLIAISL